MRWLRSFFVPSALPSPEPATPIATDAVVIGAGPIGLFLVFQLGLQGLRAHLIDTLPHPGGQCVELYGDKPIYDIPALPVCSAHELVQRLAQQMAPFAPVQHLGEQVSTLKSAQIKEYGSAKQPARSFIRKTVQQHGGQTIEIVTKDLDARVQKIVAKLAAQNKGR